MNEKLTFNDILEAEPQAEALPISQTFDAKGKPFEVTIRTDCATDADAFYGACEIVAKYSGDAVKDMKPLKVIYPGNRGKTFEVSNALYMGELDLLSFLVVEPKMNIEQWAMAGNKFGPGFIKSIAQFAVTINSLVDPMKVDLDPKDTTANAS